VLLAADSPDRDFATDELTVALEEAIVERRKIQGAGGGPAPRGPRSSTASGVTILVTVE
jgi:hypothetical protein